MGGLRSSYFLYIENPTLGVGFSPLTHFVNGLAAAQPLFIYP